MSDKVNPRYLLFYWTIHVYTVQVLEITYYYLEINELYLNYKSHKSIINLLDTG